MKKKPTKEFIDKINKAVEKAKSHEHERTIYNDPELAAELTQLAKDEGISSEDMRKLLNIKKPKKDK